jgi:hypothetical protein
MMQEINAASGGLFNLTSIKTDPWGDIYRIDSNQAEVGLAGCNAVDGIWVNNRRNLDNKFVIPLSPICP